MDLTSTQKIALKLIVEDLRFANSVLLVNKNNNGYSYPVALQPYLGLITDGIEQWSGKVKVVKNIVPKFTKLEKLYYTALRNNIKLWENDLFCLSQKLEDVYNINDEHFANVCKPIAKSLKLYDIYGCYIIDGYFCDNTILDCIYTPYFNLGNPDGEYIKSMSEFLGRLVAIFGAHKLRPLSVNTKMKFKTEDYCGFLPAPTGFRKYDGSFVLFSVMCSINFLIFGIDKYIIDETPTKLRFIYVQYFYLVKLIKEINKAFQSSFSLDERWHNTDMRSCLAHYGLGSVLGQKEVIETDAFGGLTNKLFDCDWRSLENILVTELWNLSEQIREFIKIR